jgi:DNA-binding transcriptional ArsR family regulator
MPDLDVFQAIAHPSRRELLDALRTGELPVRTLAERFESSRPATSQHLRVLLDAGLVGERRIGRENLYRLTPEPLAQVESWVGTYEQFWNAKLRALRTVLDAAE